MGKQYPIINSVIAKLRQFSIKRRLILTFLLLSMGPLLIVSVMSSFMTSRSIKSKTIDYSEQLLTHIDWNIQRELQKTEDFAVNLSIHQIIQEGLIDFDSTDYVTHTKSYELINTTLVPGLINYIKNIKILTIDSNKHELFYEIGYDWLNEDSKSKLIYDLNTKKYDIWDVVVSEKNEKLIVFARTIIDRDDYSNEIGYLYVGLDEEYFAKTIFKDISVVNSSHYFVMDSDGRIVSELRGNDLFREEFEYSEIKTKLLENAELDSTSFDNFLNQENYLFSYIFDSKTNWYIVSATPYSYINKDSDQFVMGIIIIALVCFAVSLTIAALIYYSIFYPLYNIMDATDSIIDGDLDNRINDSSNDELSDVAKKFDFTVQKISELINDVKTEQQDKRKAEIKMLQAQINPHFLFNTLNSIKWTAMINDQMTISNGIGAVADILRNTIINHESHTSLSQELANVKSYIYIQKIRYGDIFDVEYDIDPATEKCLLPKLILQPIVENSILHGLHEEQLDGKINIYSRKEDQTLVIKVVDNGFGFTEDEVEEKRKKQMLSGIGLSNVKDRIILEYGLEYGVKLVSEKGKGTEAIIKIPFQLEDNNDSSHLKGEKPNV